jgi:hypothetical protein
MQPTPVLLFHTERANQAIAKRRGGPESFLTKGTEDRGGSKRGTRAGAIGFIPTRFYGRYWLIPGLGVKLSTIILAGPTVLSAVGVNPPHDGVR